MTLGGGVVARASLRRPDTAAGHGGCAAGEREAVTPAVSAESLAFVFCLGTLPASPLQEEMGG